MTVAVGFFDGVHLGHQAILKGADFALTFRNHPLTVLCPEKAPHLIQSTGDRLAAIRACGVKAAVALDFTRDLANLSPDDFADGFLTAAAFQSPGNSVGRARPAIRCGANWTFGRGGKANAETLRAMGYEVEIVPYAEYRGEAISSTRIRRALAAGALDEAAAMLGRPFAVSGAVRSGKGVGRSLGFPTLNLEPDLRLDLPCGVYAVEAAGARGVANYGLAPTMGERAWPQPVLEVHFLGGPVPAEEPVMRVTLLRYLRPERRFASADELRTQIASDCEAATKCAAECGK